MASSLDFDIGTCAQKTSCLLPHWLDFERLPAPRLEKLQELLWNRYVFHCSGLTFHQHPPPRKLHTNYYLWGPKRWPSCTLMMSTMWNLVRRRGWSAVRVCTVSRFQLKTWIWNLEITLWFQVKSVKEWSPQIESTLYTSKDKLHTRVFFFVAWQPIPDISSGSSYIHLSLDCYNFFGRSRLVASLVLWRESRNSRWGHFMDLSKSGKTEELEFL